jgi:hypothetical protein
MWLLFLGIKEKTCTYVNVIDDNNYDDVVKGGSLALQHTEYNITYGMQFVKFNTESNADTCNVANTEEPARLIAPNNICI